MNELDGLILIPVVDPETNKLTQLRVRFQNSPGAELVFTASSIVELRDGLTAMLNVTDWTKYHHDQLQLRP